MTANNQTAFNSIALSSAANILRRVFFLNEMATSNGAQVFALADRIRRYLQKNTILFFSISLNQSMSLPSKSLAVATVLASLIHALRIHICKYCLQNLSFVICQILPRANLHRNPSLAPTRSPHAHDRRGRHVPLNCINPPVPPALPCVLQRSFALAVAHTHSWILRWTIRCPHSLSQPRRCWGN